MVLRLTEEEEESCFDAFSHHCPTTREGFQLFTIQSDNSPFTSYILFYSILRVKMADNDDVLEQYSEESADFELKTTQKCSRYFKCCVKKQYTTYICKNCGGAYHESCAKRLMDKSGLSFLDETFIKCCEMNESTKTTIEKSGVVKNGSGESEIGLLNQENTAMKYENQMLRAEIQHLKSILDEYKESRERLISEINDKNLILKQNNQLLFEKIERLENDDPKKLASKHEKNCQIINNKNNESNDNLTVTDIPMSRITSKWKPQNTLTSNNKQNPKMHERDFSKNQKLTTTSTGKGNDVEGKGKQQQTPNITRMQENRINPLDHGTVDVTGVLKDRIQISGKDGQQMGEWNLVGHKRKTSKQSRPAPIKGELEKFNLTIAENQCCLFVSGLNPDVDAQKVKDYIDETFNIKCKCEKMKTKRDKFRSSFKIYVPVDSKNKVMNGSMWGKGIIVNHFLHLRRNIDRELNQVIA